jgi:8-oxo-dGTP pyrophosphatase MutT (NUDIX family)
MRKYVAGFLIKGDSVLLVRKNRPQWQVGLLNGIGGEIDGEEHPDTAMEREFQEETGRLFTGWQGFASETGPGYMVYFYRMWIPTNYQWSVPLANDVGEVLMWYPLDTKEPAIGNLSWLLPLARDPREIVVIAKTSSDIRGIRTW